MTTHDFSRPLAFFDVDGVLNRWVSRSVARQRGYARLTVAPHDFFESTVCLDPAGDAELVGMLAEHFDFAWGTTWEHEAPRLLSPVLGFGADWPVAVNESPAASKAPGVIKLAGGRPFVWFDDDTTATERAQVAEAGGLVIEVEDRKVTAENAEDVTGLTRAHVLQALAFAGNLQM